MNKETKFTPGPWKVNEYDSAWVHGPLPDKIGICSLRHKDGDKRRDADANAALIAAAPAMYAALEKALPYLEEMQKDNFADEEVGIYYDQSLEDALVSTEQALALARGESPEP